MFFRSSIALLATLGPILASSAPTENNVFSTFKARYAEASSSNSIAKRDDSATSGTCDLSTAQMPTTPSGPLPPPSAGLVLEHIAIGRGTQNYTCANSTAQAVPVAIGALATLFNVTCLAGPYPQLLSLLPDIALRFPVPDPTNVLSPANLFLSGHHFFEDSTTPTFNLNTTTHDWGTVACKKNNTMAAPNPATDVAWLKLQSKARDGCTIDEVYRLNTRGGQPPATCAGQSASFEVQYSAEYWMWSNPDAASYGT